MDGVSLLGGVAHCTDLYIHYSAPSFPAGLSAYRSSSSSSLFPAAGARSSLLPSPPLPLRLLRIPLLLRQYLSRRRVMMPLGCSGVCSGTCRG